MGGEDPRKGEGMPAGGAQQEAKWLAREELRGGRGSVTREGLQEERRAPETLLDQLPDC